MTAAPSSVLSLMSSQERVVRQQQHAPFRSRSIAADARSPRESIPPRGRARLGHPSGSVGALCWPNEPAACAGLRRMFVDRPHDHSSGILHPVALEHAVEDDSEPVSFLHDVEHIRSHHVVPAPGIEEPSRGVADGRSNLSHPPRLEGHHDVPEPTDHGNRRHVKAHVAHLHPDVRGDLGGVSTEVLPSTQGGTKGIFWRR